MKNVTFITAALLLTGCFAGAGDYEAPKTPETWSAYKNATLQSVQVDSLKDWWKRFEDPVINRLVDLTLQDSPDRRIAEGRVLEARGLRRTARAGMFPQIGASGEAGREDNGINPSDNFYDAGFDASFELDVFGANRNRSSAAREQLIALEAQYQDVTLTLLSEVIRTYIEYREFEKQVTIAGKNLEIQEKTLELIRAQKEVGESPQLDVERSETLVNTTRASIPEFKRRADNARLRLTVLTGNLPGEIAPILEAPATIPGADIRPVLLSPAEVLSLRPDIRAAEANFLSKTDLAEAATAEFFPSFTLGGFYGVADNALLSSATVWNVALGAAVSLIDFGRIEGRIDAARAVEMQAYEQYRRTVLEAVTEVETALTDYARINEQHLSLRKAFDNADRALVLSQSLFREGEVSFIDVLDAQRTVNEADSALVSAEAAQVKALVRIYKALGIY